MTGKKDTEHLMGFDCPSCNHSAIAHFRNPSCRVCRCISDPLCWCGSLTSAHVIILPEQ